ncbi:hypothetical protein SAMN04489724_0625 [Algoriphagus locisalis]|uniref:Uncharacterized protein n=1 Tax=Algoriphagus locisalis TaxID=305507 RepID=A0A1I6XR64_9BACT|nr:hypothetical protein [Algoriphagus locisalis]SFT40790.1 hypothetical protein SAMN04489724_0625 [Algoriphagus locisalis]
MKYRIKITNLSFDLEFEPMNDSNGQGEKILKQHVTGEEFFLSSSVIENMVKSSDKFITLEDFEYDWEKAIEFTQNSDTSIIRLQNGKKYRIREYKAQKLKKDLFIVSEGQSQLVFGIDNYDQWNSREDKKQDRYVFDLGAWNSRIGIVNVDLKSAVTTSEVQPYYRGIFKNSPSKNQSGSIALVNSDTDMEFGLLYSGSQDDDLLVIQKKVNFKGVIWQELKANHGGGLKLVMEDCDLEQVDPPTYYRKEIVFTQNSAKLLEGSFNQIENMFQGMGNSSNIIYCEGMTFMLPPNTFLQNYHNRYNHDTIGQANQDTSHYIHTIPKKGDRFLMSRSYQTNGEVIPDMLRNVINWEKLGLSPIPNTVRSLQAGDRIKIQGVEYLIKVTDRVNGVMFNSEYRFNNQDSYYSQEFKLDKALPENLPMVLEVEVIASRAEALMDGKPHQGYIIFKYNKNWQTNVDINHGLEYMLQSNPFGVLSYNHKEISIWARNTKHNGFYRQSKSGIGTSKGYTLINCQGFDDQFSPDIAVKSNGQMDERAAEFISFLENL